MSSNPLEALQRAQSGQSTANYAAIIRGFVEKGIPADQITPRENVFTYNAWQAKGRMVKRGEHGVRCITFVPMQDKATGQTVRRPRTTVVFHVSQTEPVGQSGIALDRTADHRPIGQRTRTDAEIIADAKGKALVQLNEMELLAMMREMERANAVASPALYPDAATDTSDAWRNDAKTIDVTPTERIRTPQLPPINADDMRTARERVLAGEPVNIMDLMPDKIDARPNAAPLKPQVKRRNFAF